MNSNMEYRHFLINNTDRILDNNQENIFCNSILVNYNNINLKDYFKKINNDNENSLKKDYINKYNEKKNNQIKIIFDNN